MNPQDCFGRFLLLYPCRGILDNPLPRPLLARSLGVEATTNRTELAKKCARYFWAINTVSALKDNKYIVEITSRHNKNNQCQRMREGGVWL